MTCIVGIAQDNKVWMGCDSAITLESGFKDTIRDRKVWKTGELMFGCSGSLRAAQIVRYETAFKKHVQMCSMTEYMIKVIVAEVKRATQSKDGGGKEFNGTLMIGYQGWLFEMASDFSLVSSTANYAGIGSGGELALGAFYATAGEQLDIPPETRITTALEAATRFNSGCAPPYFIEVL